ncbi:hypothetical protein PRIPAC_93588 [Pristionchus pacificus]|uniref:Zinc finger protein n=1 Tax=Pristionchus pacificus TaxID=54126 RepID=A0A2A6CHC5_PRIPA|nr:hypothetical protein PRIPAC_93588 [Pristionchus pacificus]|eukprot:PDM77496.1 zinc finger protein [Pristionchus pacificus]
MAAIKSDPSKCGICWKDITIKRTVSLKCRHSLHRTCFVSICESALCPVRVSRHPAQDERNKTLPSIILYGPTGKPSMMQWRTRLLHDSRNFTRRTDFHLENIAKWLQRTSEDLELAHAAKLLDRRQTFVRLQEEAAEAQDRFRIAAKYLHVSTAGANVEEAAAAAAQVVVEGNVGAAAAAFDEVCDSEEERCGVCFEGIQRKRTAILEPCKHTFHRTCIIRWLEQQEDDFISGDAVPEKDPFVFVKNGTQIVESIFQSLTMQLIHAVRDDRSQEYVNDIREEMEKYKRRSLALDRFKFFLVEKKRR